MDDDPSTPDPSPAADDRLDSWKEIAAYLKRDVTTVQRWEKREGMPVRRHLHAKQGSVYALRSELDAWARGRDARLASEATEEPPAPALRRRWPRLAAAALAAAAVALAVAGLWARREGNDPARRLARAHSRFLTDFDGVEQAAAVSHDGRFVAFLSDRDGKPDVWVTQVGTGHFYNLTRGRFDGLVNPSVRTMGFSPDDAMVTFWARRPGSAGGADIGIWAVPVLGGEPQPYLDGVAEYAWSSDGRLAYHTPGPGDPMFVREAGQPTGRPIFTAPAGLHAHFPLWSPDRAFIYFVQGVVPDAMDIWRIAPAGGAAERITNHDARVSHPVMPDARTVLYLAAEKDGSGPWLYAVDVDRRVPQRVSSGVERYSSLAASADGRMLAVTLADPKRTLWRLALQAAPEGASAPAPIALTTASGFFPRIGPGFLVYASSRGPSDSLWKLAGGTTTELWTAPEARIIGSPAVDGDGRRIAFSVAQRGATQLYVMNADGTEARVVTGALELRGAPAWAPGGREVLSAAVVDGMPRVVTIGLDGKAAPLLSEYSLDPVWAPGGAFIAYSGPDVGTTFPVKAATPAGARHALPEITLTRGGRRIRFLAEPPALVVMRGDMQHKDLWAIDARSGQERRLTTLPADFDLRDFDVSPDGREVVLERVQERADVVLIEAGAR